MGALIQEMTIQDYDEVRALWQESEGLLLSEVDSGNRQSTGGPLPIQLDAHWHPQMASFCPRR